MNDIWCRTWTERDEKLFFWEAPIVAQSALGDLNCLENCLIMKIVKLNDCRNVCMIGRELILSTLLVTIGCKIKHKFIRARDFLEAETDFQHDIIIYPGVSEDVSQKFWEKSLTLLKPNGIVCLTTNSAMKAKQIAENRIDKFDLVGNLADYSVVNDNVLSSVVVKNI